jgi:ADP-heptose:LPS heptosyltransferase
MLEQLPTSRIITKRVPQPAETKPAIARLRQFRRRLAPPGSRREKIARLFYAPVLSALPGNPFVEVEVVSPTMVAEVVTLQDVATDGFRRSSVRRMLVFKLDHIGDLVVGMRALRVLREGFPEAHITLVCGSWNVGYAQQLGIFDRVVAFDFFTPLNRDWTGGAETLRSLYARVEALPLDTYDLAVDLRHDADTRPCLYRVRAKFRAGFQAPPVPGEPYLDLLLPISEAIPVADGLAHSLHADLRLQVLASAVVSAFAPPRPHPARALLPSCIEPGLPRFAVLAVGAGDPIRCWPIEHYGEVGRALIAQYGMDVVVIGSRNEAADVMRLAGLMPSAHVRSMIGAPLAELPALLAGAALCVCNGSGVSHLAAALGVPTLAILGGTTRMEVWHPAGPNAVSVGGRTPCQPCGLRLASECPWDVACLAVVQPAHVLAACKELLSKVGYDQKALTA